jgi:hypothetical protein
MKKFLLPFLFISICFIACQKDTIESKTGFVSIVESELDYTTRNCLQLSDGNYLVCGSSVNYPAGNTAFGNSYSMMAKFSQSGDLIWQKKLPITLYDLWKSISLPGGGFILTGLDNLPENTNITIAEYNNDGGLVKTNQLLNYTKTNGASKNQVDICALSNGNIAMVLVGINPGVVGSSPRIILFDQDLNIISDKIYSSMFSPIKNYEMQRITEGNNGTLYICGRTQEFSAWSWTFLMGVNATTLEQGFFTERMGGDTNSYPSPFIIGDAGHVIIPSAEQFNAGIYFNESNYFYNHLDEYFSIGKTVTATETDGLGNFIGRHRYSGFSGNASVTGITRAKDGGYLLVGTCGIITDAVINSSFQILLIKTDARFNQEWMKQINTTYPAIAVDVKSTGDGGFLIGAYEKSFNKNYKMMLVKTDANGNM